MSKNYQNKLNFICSPPETEDDTLDFVLKINEGHLSDLEISTVSNLLLALGTMVDLKQARFNVIKEGSTTIAISVPEEYKQIAISNIQKNNAKNKNQIEKIKKELRHYGLNQASISYGKFIDDKYIPYEELLSVNKGLDKENFLQEDCFEGKITRLQVGKENCDHITIVLDNGKQVPAECAKQLLMQLHEYFNTEKRIRFTGIATYIKCPDSLEVLLKKYSINDFVVIDDIDIDEWIQSFRNKGQSNWQEFENPISEWLKEREK